MYTQPLRCFRFNELNYGDQRTNAAVDGPTRKNPIRAPPPHLAIVCPRRSLRRGEESDVHGLVLVQHRRSKRIVLSLHAVVGGEPILDLLPAAAARRPTHAWRRRAPSVVVRSSPLVDLKNGRISSIFVLVFVLVAAAAIDKCCQKCLISSRGGSSPRASYNE